MEHATLDKVVEHFRAVQKRPGMFLGGVTEQAFFNHQCGFHSAWAICGGRRVEEEYWAVCEERGWPINALGPQKHMRNAGWTEAAIVEELIIIEILTWEHLRDKLDVQQMPAS